MNLNDFAREITLKEGKKLQVSIGQVKEIVRIVLTLLAKLNPVEVDNILSRYRGKF